LRGAIAIADAGGIGSLTISANEYPHRTTLLADAKASLLFWRQRRQKCGCGLTDLAGR
jgi:hypothetical protein